MARRYVIDKSTGYVYYPTLQSPGRKPTTFVTGVSWVGSYKTPRSNPWRARARVYDETKNRLKTVFIGCFPSVQEAEEAIEDALQASIPMGCPSDNPRFIPKKMQREFDELIAKRVIWGV